MRQYILFVLLSLLALSGCVNYAGLHTNAKTYDTQSLSQPHTYTLPKSNAPTPTDPIAKTNAPLQPNTQGTVAANVRLPAAVPITAMTPASAVQPAASQWWLRFHDPELNQLMVVALADSPTLDVVKARIENAEAQTTIAKSTLVPNVSFDGYVNRERYTGTSYIPPPFGGNYVSQGYVPITATYDLDFWGLHRQQVAAATSTIQAQAAELASAQLILSAQIATTYYQLRSHISQLAALNQVVAKQKTLLSIAQVRTAHGLTTDIPTNQAISELESAKINAENQEKWVEISKHQLATLMGKNPLTTTFDVASFQFLPQQVALPANIPAHLIAQRPDVIASRWQVEASAHDIKVAKARFFPDINLTAFFSYQSIGLNQLFDQNSRDILFQPALSLPLFDGGQLRGNVSRRDATYDANVSQYNETLLTALQQVGDGVSRLSTVQQQIQAQDLTVDSLRHNVALVNLQYQRGIVDASQLLIAQTNLLNQQLYQLQLQTGQMQNAIALIQALGGSNYA